MSVAIDACLQCGESRESVKRNKYFCATLTGYETVEVQDEWERHHWRDWSDAELRGMGIEPHLWNANRRTHIYNLEFVIAESHCYREGHREPDPEYSGKDHCPVCWTNVTEQRASGQEVKMRKEQEA